MRDAAELSADIAIWSERLARTGAAVETLTQNETYLRLKALSRTGGLDGETAAAAARAIGDADRLWQLYLVLDRTIAQAKELAASRNPFGYEERLGRIDALLSHPVIEDRPAAQALATLSLSGDAGEKDSIGDVFQKMEKMFAATRDTVATAEKGWAGTQALDAREQQIAAIVAEAAALGVAAPATLPSLTSKIEQARRSILRDPVGAATLDVALDAEIAAARDALAGASNDRASARKAIDDATAFAATLAARRERATAQRTRRLAEILEPPPQTAMAPDAASDAAAWIARLEATFQASRYRACLIGAKSLAAELAMQDERLEAVMRDDERVLLARDDLRARLYALKPRIERALQGPAPEESRRAYETAQALLFGARTPLPQAVQAMRVCEKI